MNKLAAHVGRFLDQVVDDTVALEVSSGARATARARTLATTSLTGDYVPMSPDCRMDLNTYMQKCAFGPPVDTEMDPGG